MADVIGLIRHHQLTSAFARHLEKTLRPAFRKLVRLIQREKSRKVSGKSIERALVSGKPALHNVAVELAISPRAEAAIGRRRVALQK